MKKILFSLALIGLAATGGVLGTRAWFSDAKVLGNNTFATGTVKLDESLNQSITVTGLKPGQEVEQLLAFNYVGSLGANLFLGAGGTSGKQDPAYIADHLYLKIYLGDTWKWEGYVSELSEEWTKIATVEGSTGLSYKLKFRLDANTPNEHQGVTNIDTVLVVMAVQKEAPAPLGEPWKQIINFENVNPMPYPALTPYPTPMVFPTPTTN